MVKQFESNCLCLNISPSELILVFEMINYITCLCDLIFMRVYSCLYICMCYMNYWNWHTCIPYALRHPRTIGVSAWYKSGEDGSEGSLKMLIIGG